MRGHHVRAKPSSGTGPLSPRAPTGVAAVTPWGHMEAQGDRLDRPEATQPGQLRSEDGPGPQNRGGWPQRKVHRVETTPSLAQSPPHHRPAHGPSSCAIPTPLMLRVQATHFSMFLWWSGLPVPVGFFVLEQSLARGSCICSGHGERPPWEETFSDGPSCHKAHDTAGEALKRRASPPLVWGQGVCPGRRATFRDRKDERELLGESEGGPGGRASPPTSTPCLPCLLQASLVHLDCSPSEP